MEDLRNWRGRSAPALPPIRGAHVSIEPFDATAHSAVLFAALGGAGNEDLWRFIPTGPFTDEAALAAMLEFSNAALGWKTHVLQAHEGDAIGMASYMRVRPEHGSAEVGCIVYARAFQRSAAATEAIYLMARHLFDDLGYRRFEWKCDDRNEASKRAATRLGFVFEGLFRQDMVVKGRSRDTAWFSITDLEWPRVRRSFERWLAPGNFDAAGLQRASLSEIRAIA